jgi:glycosyltransferase involved in cell wall biosynthesis
VRTPPAIRALYLLRRADYGPDTRLLWHLLAHLPRREVEPAVCFLEDGPLTAQWATTLSLKARALAAEGRAGSGGGGGRKAAHAVAGMVRGIGAQVIHAFGAAAQIVAGKAAQETGIPGVWTQPGVTRLGRLTDLRASLAPTHAVLLHSALGEQAQRRLLVRRRGCRRITTGVGLPERLPEHRRAAARELLGLPGDAVIAASLGPLDDSRGVAHECFLRAGASLCHARAAAQLVIAGTHGTSGGARTLAARVAALGLAPRTRIADPSQLATALDAADIAVHANGDHDELPVELIQALAAGLAVVVHDGPLVAEIVALGDTALATPRGDDEALAVALLALADDPRRRLALAGAAAAAARDHHDADRMAAEVIAVYREMLAA